ncbi:MAG: hypothetical protein OEW68_12030 [Gammaproteobacteria bacterium]|nr:hypothetical protein [Gammaproteobacteria bacterium]MDH4315563.1 hypothetical protein [Gammaproteobacteria bacterium]MDH5215300.1 hypothetical protein [Gammaproteobacteria bacterium]
MQYFSRLKTKSMLIGALAAALPVTSSATDDSVGVWGIFFHD